MEDCCGETELESERAGSIFRTTAHRCSNEADGGFDLTQTVVKKKKNDAGEGGWLGSRRLCRVVAVVER